MNQHINGVFTRLRGLLVLGIVLSAVLFFAASAYAADNSPSSGERLITIHDGDEEKVIVTSAKTIKEALASAKIVVHDTDKIEPSLDTELIAKNYQVNVYRARPVIVIDGETHLNVMTPYQSPRQIAEDAGLELHDEDITELAPNTDIISGGASLELSIDRAVPFSLILYGKKVVARTQANTVGEMLKEKEIVLQKNDTLSVAENTVISEDMKVEIWRNGKQTVTQEEKIDFPIEQIQDTDREVGYRDVQTEGVAGIKNVTYEIVMKNGKQVSKKVIQSVVLKQPKKQVEIVGAKSTFSGDFADALAKLRSCEGGYGSWNPAGPYYGAYQFDRQTWGTVADPSKYGSASPAEQDAAAYELYLRRGWQPWPSCGSSLPDIYR